MKAMTSLGVLVALTMTLPTEATFAQGAAAGAARDNNIILRQTERAQHEPGVTSELAPDAKQTATGGPSGGVPGFSGGQ